MKLFIDTQNDDLKNSMCHSSKFETFDIHFDEINKYGMNDST